MISQAFEWISTLVKRSTEVQDIGGVKYSAEPLWRVPADPTAKSFGVTSLSGVVDYLREQKDSSTKEKNLLLHVESPTTVRVFSALNADAQRSHLIHSNAIIPDFNFEHWYDVEEMIIKLQAGFIPNEHAALITSVIGNISDNEVTSWNDDGFSQGVTTRQSLVTEEKVVIPPRVVLQPFRTFLEVEQPASEFVIRLRKHPHGDKPRVALFEADGGAWRVAATENVRKYLQEEINDSAISGITILA